MAPLPRIEPDLPTAGRYQFDAVPDYHALEALPREFSFAPCRNQTPHFLTPAQIEQFNEQGFVSPVPVFSSDEIAEHRAWFDRLLAQVLADGGDAYSISTAHLTYRHVLELLATPAIVSAVADLIGPNVIGWGSHYFCKLPGDPKSVTWHQDAAYWPLSPTRAVTVWLAIDDADPENGCMQFIAGSHRHGRLPWRLTEESDHSVLNQRIEHAETLGPIIDNVLRAGEISIHSDLLVHGSHANLSARRRCGLTLRYGPPYVQAWMGWYAKGVRLRGVDSTGKWGPGCDLTRNNERT